MSLPLFGWALFGTALFRPGVFGEGVLAGVPGSLLLWPHITLQILCIASPWVGFVFSGFMRLVLLFSWPVFFMNCVLGRRCKLMQVSMQL